MKTEIETEEGIWTGIETEVEVETDLETGVVIEDPDIVVAMREHDGSMYIPYLYTLIHLVHLNSLYFSFGGMTFFNQLAQSFISWVSAE